MVTRLSPTCVGEGGERGGAAEEAGGEKLRLIGSAHSQGAVKMVDVRIHGLGLPQI